MDVMAEFIASAQAFGLRAERVESTGINLWTSGNGNRWPDDTVWLSAEGWTWGADFQHGAPLDTDIDVLVLLVRDC